MSSSGATEFWFIGAVATSCSVFFTLVGNAMNAGATAHTSDKPGTRQVYGRLRHFYFGCAAAWLVIVCFAVSRIWRGDAGWTVQNFLYATNAALFLLWAASAWSHRRTNRAAAGAIADAMWLHNSAAKIRLDGREPELIKGILVARRLSIRPKVSQHGTSQEDYFCDCQMSLFRFAENVEPPPELRLTSHAGTLEIAKLAIDQRGSSRPGVVYYSGQAQWSSLQQTARQDRLTNGMTLHDVEIRLPTGAALAAYHQSRVMMGFEIAPEHVELVGDVVSSTGDDGQLMSVEVQPPAASRGNANRSSGGASASPSS